MSEYEAAMAILRKVQGDLQALGFEMYNYGDIFSPVGYSDDVGERLFETEPFRKMRGKWLADPGGGGEAIEVRFGRWAVMSLFTGSEPEKIISQVEELAASNSAEFADVWICSGFTVTGRVNICHGAYLQDLAELPGYGVDSPARAAHCALVLPYTVSPILVDELVPDHAHRDNGPLVKLIQRALVLSGEASIRITKGPRALSLTPGLPRRYQQPLEKFAFPKAHKGPCPDLDGLSRILPALEKLSANRSLEIAIDRVNRARTSEDPVDAALDYGVAMEVALMHGDETAKSEIANKLGMRAGWLLGKDPASRRDIKSRAGVLYSGRSDAAHKGYFGKDTQKKYDPADANRLVTDVVRTIVERGNFPDWTDLVFGG